MRSVYVALHSALTPTQEKQGLIYPLLRAGEQYIQSNLIPTAYASLPYPPVPNKMGHTLTYLCALSTAFTYLAPCQTPLGTILTTQLPTPEKTQQTYPNLSLCATTPCPF